MRGESERKHTEEVIRELEGRFEHHEVTKDWIPIYTVHYFHTFGCTTFCLEHILEWNLESERELRTEEEK